MSINPANFLYVGSSQTFNHEKGGLPIVNHIANYFKYVWAIFRKRQKVVGCK